MPYICRIDQETFMREGGLIGYLIHRHNWNRHAWHRARNNGRKTKLARVLTLYTEKLEAE